MIVSYEKPPNYEAIVKRFPVIASPSHQPIFAWNLIIYNPHKVALTRALIAHEEVHSARQVAVGGAAPWWDRYLTDDNFRLIEELAAHVVEYKVLCEGTKPGRKVRRQIFHFMAARLRDPIYGYSPPLPYDRVRQFFKRALKEAEKPAKSAYDRARQFPPVNPNAI